MSDTIFYKIVKGEIPCKKVYEDEYCLAFDDTNPQAPVHVVVVPKSIIRGLGDVSDANQFKEICGHILSKVHHIASLKDCAEGGYRLISNSGVNGQQTVQYLHFHIIGGRQLSWPPG